MILYQDLTVCIRLQQDEKIICVRWFDQPTFRMADFEFSFMTLIQNLELYGIRKLLVQTSKTMMHLPDEEYKSVIALLQSGLAHTKVQKVAKLYIDKSERDIRCKEYFQQLLNEMDLKIEFRNFETKASALAWLKKEKSKITF